MNEKILRIPYSAVNEDWNFLQKYLKAIGNPKYILVGDVNLELRKYISDLGNLAGVVGNLWLSQSSIESLGELEFVDGYLSLRECQNLKTLGKIKKVKGNFWLNYSPIESLGELEYVGGDLWIDGTNIPPSELNNVNVVGKILR